MTNALAAARPMVPTIAQAVAPALMDIATHTHAWNSHITPRTIARAANGTTSTPATAIVRMATRARAVARMRRTVGRTGVRTESI